MNYHTLNDARCISPVFEKGARFQIWYMTTESLCSLMPAVSIWGVASSQQHDANIALPTNLEELMETHRLLGSIRGQGASLNSLYALMQGESWSPQGEACALIQNLGLSHTSMTCGDVVVENGTMWMLDRQGFVNLGAY